MKTYKLVQIASQVLLASFMLSGCGGSGDSSSGGSVDLTKITPKKAEEFAQSAAAALPGCEYTSDSAIGSGAEFQSTNLLYKNAVSSIVDAERNKFTISDTEIDDRVDGNCPVNPGYYTKKGTHSNGVETLTYTFVDYCTGDENESTTITGTVYPKSVGIPSDSGPVFQYLQVSSGDMTVVQKSLEGTNTYKLTGNNVKYTNGNGADANATQENPNKVEIGSFTVVDGNTTNSYGIKNVNVSSYPDGNNSTITTIQNMTYSDSSAGTISIKTSTPLITDVDGVITSGNILVTGADGTTLTMAPYPSVKNGFGVKVNDEVIGVMDCSGLTQE